MLPSLVAGSSGDLLPMFFCNHCVVLAMNSFAGTGLWSSKSGLYPSASRNCLILALLMYGLSTSASSLYASGNVHRLLSFGCLWYAIISAPSLMNSCALMSIFMRRRPHIYTAYKPLLGTPCSRLWDNAVLFSCKSCHNGCRNHSLYT